MRLKRYITEAISKYAVLGVNQDMDVCDVCGKVGLKKVVWFSELNSQGEKVGNPFCTGVDCAAKLMTQTQGTNKKPPKRMMDNIWKVAQGIDKAKEYVVKYKTKKEFNKLSNFLTVRYPLQVVVVTDPVDDEPLGLIVWDLTNTDSMWTLSVTGVNKRWPEKTKEVAGRNWLRNKR
jgi:hypothetical protein